MSSDNFSKIKSRGKIVFQNFLLCITVTSNPFWPLDNGGNQQQKVGQLAQQGAAGQSGRNRAVAIRNRAAATHNQSFLRFFPLLLQEILSYFLQTYYKRR
jgi:hypothetical protein